MPTYGVSIEDFSDEVSKWVDKQDRDWGVDAAVYLALAFYSIKRLENMGVNISLKGRELVRPLLEQAWRELLYIRWSNTPYDVMANDIARPLTLSRSGRVLNEDQFPISIIRRYYSNPVTSSKSRKRNVRPRRTPGVRTRRVSQPCKSKDPGSSSTGS